MTVTSLLSIKLIMQLSLRLLHLANSNKPSRMNHLQTIQLLAHIEGARVKVLETSQKSLKVK